MPAQIPSFSTPYFSLNQGFCSRLLMREPSYPFMVLQKKPTKEKAYSHSCPFVHAYGGSLIMASSKASLPLTILVSTCFFSGYQPVGHGRIALKHDGSLQGSHPEYDCGQCPQSRSSQTWPAVMALGAKESSEESKTRSCLGSRRDCRLRYPQQMVDQRRWGGRLENEGW